MNSKPIVVDCLSDDDVSVPCRKEFLSRLLGKPDVRPAPTTTPSTNLSALNDRNTNNSSSLNKDDLTKKFIPSPPKLTICAKTNRSSVPHSEVILSSNVEPRNNIPKCSIVFNNFCSGHDPAKRKYGDISLAQGDTETNDEFYDDFAVEDESNLENVVSISQRADNIILTAADLRSWEVVLYVDSREKEYLFIQGKMLEVGLLCEVRTLALGDYLWVARSPSSSNTVVVLDCIAERKTNADLASSIIDRRYQEQKMRLNSCGLDYCFYIVEGPLIAPSQQSFVNSNSLKSAVVATEIESGMHVLRTRNGDHTASMLRAHHERLTRRFRAGQCGLEFQSYPAFQQRCGKQQIKTTGELFLHVLRMAPNCSTAAALTLQNRFGTLPALVEFLETTEPNAAKRELSQLRKGPDGRPGQRLGPKLAMTIHNIFGDDF